MSSTPMKNAYLAQVVQEREELEEELRVNKKALGIAEQHQIAERAGRFRAPSGTNASGVDVRVTGFWRWKNVIVPPNAYVVHTRRGRAEPMHLGMGVSFRFDPVTDTFMVVPATLQTIIIHANCICAERQGLVVQGYVQWIIDDFAAAYRKLDFTDPDEPMRVVNVQLREQAEAAIKDMVSTMSIDDVLSDKQPIIEGLTSRLRHVAEGDGGSDGLGLRIVTVQIKEAVVGSPRLWETLQRPFRAERAKAARIAELNSSVAVRERETEADKHRVRLEVSAEREATETRAAAAVAKFEQQQSDRITKSRLEAEAIEQTMAHERAKLAQQAALERLRLESELATATLRSEHEHALEARQLDLLATRRRIDNDRSPNAVRMAFVDALPAIAAELPKGEELRSLSIGEAPLSKLAGGLVELLPTANDA